MKHGATGSANSKIGKIIESPKTDNTSKLPLKHAKNMMDFNSDANLKPEKGGGGTRSY